LNRKTTAQKTLTEAKTPDKPAVMVKRIGSTTYRVSVHFNKTSTETIGDKIERLWRYTI
jgi:hypothetical protein